MFFMSIKKMVSDVVFQGKGVCCFFEKKRIKEKGTVTSQTMRRILSCFIG
jgi:hypothetical protein